MQPVLLMALDDYFSDPSQDCLARLFDAVNAMDISAAPILTRNEKYVMRSSERKDIFAEKFSQLTGAIDNPQTLTANAHKTRHRPSNSTESASSFEDGILILPRDRDREPPHVLRAGRPRTDSGAPPTPSSIVSQPPQPPPPPPPPPAANSGGSPSDTSFNLGGSAVWVGDESIIEQNPPPPYGHVGSHGSSTSASSAATTSRGRRSTDTSSTSSHFGTPTPTPAPDPQHRPGVVKDSHFYHTTIAYKEHLLPIKMPLSTFPEEVGEVSLSCCLLMHSTRLNLEPVFPYHPHPSIPISTERVWPSASSSAQQWNPYPSYHYPFQCPPHWEARHFPRPQSSCWSSIRICTRSVRLGLRLWCRTSWPYRACIPVRQSDQP